MNYYSKINKLFKKNRNIKTQNSRIKILKHDYLNLLTLLQNKANYRALHSNDDRNPYYNMINEIATWITQGETNHKKNYKTNLKNENPSEIKDNMKTNNRIYNGKSNYYVDGSLIPTKVELKNKYIKQLFDTLHYYKRCHKNRFKVHKAIRDTRDDLNDAIMSFRGINHEGRNDNMPDVAPEPVVEPLDLKDVINEDPIVKDYFDGYTEIETGKRNGLNQSSVSRKLHKVSTGGQANRTGLSNFTIS